MFCATVKVIATYAGSSLPVCGCVVLVTIKELMIIAAPGLACNMGDLARRAASLDVKISLRFQDPDPPCSVLMTSFSARLIRSLHFARELRLAAISTQRARTLRQHMQMKKHTHRPAHLRLGEYCVVWGKRQTFCFRLFVFAEGISVLWVVYIPNLLFLRSKWSIVSKS